jgi:hypothetical protein
MKHLEIFNGLPTVDAELHEQFSTRQMMITHLFRKYWPNHCSIWIENIEKQFCELYPTLSNQPGPFIVINVEEDTFAYDVNRIRQVISKHPNWTSDSMFLTNSRADYESYKNLGARDILLRPCSLDLMCYAPYDSYRVPDLSAITHHTSFLARTKRQVRGILVDHLIQHGLTDRLAILKYDGHAINNTNLAFEEFHLEGFTYKYGNVRVIDSPYQGIHTDRWMDLSAFITVAECFYQSDLAPTLSEKTFKCMHHFRPAVIHGGHNTRLYLQYLGFDTWDWLVDWSFDTIKDHDQRFQGYIAEVCRLLSIPLTEILDLMENNKDSLIHNKNHVEYLLTNYTRLPWDEI